MANLEEIFSQTFFNIETLSCLEDASGSGDAVSVLDSQDLAGQRF